MVANLSAVFQHLAAWSGWGQFMLITPTEPASENIFGFAEYLASLALFLVVMTTSDFRFSYRLSLTKHNWKKFGFWLALGVGLALLGTDLWYQNHLPVPRFMANPNNVKALLGLIFLIFVFQVISAALIRPPIYSKHNAKQFFQSNYHLIHQGDPERLQVVAEELGRSIGTIISYASLLEREEINRRIKDAPMEQGFAHDFLLLIGDDRFCRIVVDKVPAFAIQTFKELHNSGANLPVFQFARNIGQGFIRNTKSAFYQEDSGYYSGLVGYTRPITKVIFGNFSFIERCAASGASPIETDYREFHGFSELQMEGYCRAALSFLENCLEVTKGGPHPHSYALARLFSSLESGLVGVSEIDGKKDMLSIPAYGRLEQIANFIKLAIEAVEKKASLPKTFRTPKGAQANIYDDLAELIFETIFAASSVTSPNWTAWSVQHNIVWRVVPENHGSVQNVIRIKVMRLMYDEIKRMEKGANFKGARILGYCLHVLGLRVVDRHRGYGREFYPLQAAAVLWTKKNFRRLLENHPKVAMACVQGSVTYDEVTHRLVKTFAGETEREPSREFLELD